MYDQAGRIRQMTTPDDVSNYDLDQTSQLTGVNHDYQADEGYTYDAAGNRTGTTAGSSSSAYTTGQNNHLAFDGAYHYFYDHEGNRLAKFVGAPSDDHTIPAGATDITVYAWDFHNRLTKVSHYATSADYSGNSPDNVVEYTYDYAGRMIRRTADPDGAGATAASSTYTVYDGDNACLEIADPTGLGNGSADSTVSHRYFYGHAVDEILAVEDATGTVRWGLADHEGTVRDVVTSAGAVAEHRVYDSFGNRTSPATSAADFLFGYTGRPQDPATGLYNYRARWYDAQVGRFVSEDPSGFAAGDMNLYRYVNNDPLDFIDPSGLQPKGSSGGGGGGYSGGLGLSTVVAGVLSYVAPGLAPLVNLGIGIYNASQGNSSSASGGWGGGDNYDGGDYGGSSTPALAGGGGYGGGGYSGGGGGGSGLSLVAIGSAIAQGAVTLANGFAQGVSYVSQGISQFVTTASGYLDQLSEMRYAPQVIPLQALGQSADDRYRSQVLQQVTTRLPPSQQAGAYADLVLQAGLTVNSSDVATTVSLGQTATITQAKGDWQLNEWLYQLNPTSDPERFLADQATRDTARAVADRQLGLNLMPTLASLGSSANSTLHAWGARLDFAGQNSGSMTLGVLAGIGQKALGGLGNTIAAVSDPAGTTAAVVGGLWDEIGRTGEIYSRHGTAVAAANVTGMLQFAEAYYGTDLLTGQAADPWEKVASGANRFSATTGAMASGLKLAGGLSGVPAPSVRMASGFGEWAGEAPLNARVAAVQQQLLQEGRVAFGRGDFTLRELGNISSGLEREVAVTRIGQTRYMTLMQSQGGKLTLGTGEKYILHTHPGQGYWGLQGSAFGTDFGGLPVSINPATGLPAVGRAAAVNESGWWRIYRSDGSLSGLYGTGR